MKLKINSFLYTKAQIRAFEQALNTQQSSDLSNNLSNPLPKKAGKAAADFLISLPNFSTDYRILCIAGPGYNGIDALYTAYFLKQQQLYVEVLLYECERPKKHPLLSDYQNALDQLRQASIPLLTQLPTEFQSSKSTAYTQRISDYSKKSRSQSKVVYTEIHNEHQSTQTTHPKVERHSVWLIDGLFGIGLSRPLNKRALQYINWINQHTQGYIIALDAPSGLDSDSGWPIDQTLNTDSTSVVHADYTFSFLMHKTGLFTGSARDFCGEIIFFPLDIPEKSYPKPAAILNYPSYFLATIPKRQHTSHKGYYGKVIAIGGAEGMTGALMLAARAALYFGAGRVFFSALSETFLYDNAQPELMCAPIQTLDFKNLNTADIIVIGPGLGQSEQAQQIIFEVLNSNATLVIDADALNLLAVNPAARPILHKRTAPQLLTPHPLEAARLLNTSVVEIQKNRLASARQLAQAFAATVVLKGSGTIICTHNNTWVNPTGNALLATPGSGDILAGMIGALLAQHVPTAEAALAAVYCHGKAAEVLANTYPRMIGVSASELLIAARYQLNTL